MCVCIAGHQSVYIAQIMRWQGSNIRQWIFLTEALGISPVHLMSKMNVSDKTRRTNDRQWSHGRLPVQTSGFPHKIGSTWYVLLLLFNPKEVQTTMTRDKLYGSQHTGTRAKDSGGLRNAVTRNLMPRWLGQGSCSPTNEHPENLPLLGSARIHYYALAHGPFMYISPFPKILRLLKSQVLFNGLIIKRYQNI